MVQLKPTDLKKIARRFTAKYYPQMISRFDRIWEMLIKTDPNLIFSDPSTPQYQQGNAFGISGPTESQSQESFSGIAIFAFTYNEFRNEKNIDENEIKKQISIIPISPELRADFQQKIKNLLNEMVPEMVEKGVESEEASEYRVWYNDSEPSGLLLDIKTKEKIVNKEKDKYNLLIVREGALTQIFINGNYAVSKPGKIGYRILTLALKYRGNCGIAFNIAKNIWDVREVEKLKDLRELAKTVKEQPKLKLALEEFKTKPGDNVEYFSNRVRKSITILRQGFLKKLDITFKANEMDEYEINPTIKYCLIEKI